MNAMDPEVHTLTGAYVCDALDEPERAAFEEHLASCASCAQEVAELRETAASLAMAVAAEPPARLRAGVDAGIAVTRQLPPDVAPIEAARERRRRRNRAAWTGWTAAAALAGVVAGLSLQVVSQQNRIDDAQQRITAIDTQVSALTSLVSAPDAHGAAGSVSTGGNVLVIHSRTRDEAAISVTGLAAPPSGKAYQLWMIGPDGARSGGVVTLDPRGSSGPILAHGIGDTTKVALTVEPAHGSAQPTTTPILLMPMPA